MRFLKGVCLALLLSGGTKERRAGARTQKKSVKRKVCSSSSRLDSLGLSFFLMGSCFKKSSADEYQCLL